MPKLYPAQREGFIRISDAIGVAYEGELPAEEQTLRPLLGPITFYDIEAKGHQIRGFPIPVIEVPVTGDKRSQTVTNVIEL